MNISNIYMGSAPLLLENGGSNRVDVTSLSYLEINNSDMSVYDLFYKSSRVVKVLVMLSGL